MQYEIKAVILKFDRTNQAIKNLSQVTNLLTGDLAYWNIIYFAYISVRGKGGNNKVS